MILYRQRGPGVDLAMYGLTAAVSGECCRRATMDLDIYDTYIVGLTVGGHRHLQMWTTWRKAHVI